MELIYKSSLIIIQKIMIVVTIIFSLNLYSAKLDLSDYKSEDPVMIAGVNHYQEKIENRQQRVVPKPEIPLAFVISSNKSSYTIGEPIIVTAEFIYTGSDSIKFIKPDYHFSKWAKLRISKVINETEMSVVAPSLAIRMVTPHLKDDWVYLGKGEKYSIDFQINKSESGYLGGDLFDTIDNYLFTLDFHNRIMVKSNNKTYYTNQFIWQSNEIEFEIKEK